MKKSILWLPLFVALSLTALSGWGVALMSPLRAASAAQAAPVAAPVTSQRVAAAEGTLEGIYQNVSPSVVYIEVVQGQSQQGPSGRGSGSGFVWDQAGHIVTNNHVVEGAGEISVTFYDGTTVPATVVGTDPNSDLAVLKVDVAAAQLHPVKLADSAQLQVGQLAVAIGNPFGLENTMTAGIVSALGRSLPVESNSIDGTSYTIPDVIQTDAPINPGNSGGVLLNDLGEVIGVTAAIVSPANVNAGVGFAIPSNIVQKVVPVLITDGKYLHPWLGLSGGSLNPDLAQATGLDANQRGVLVAEVVPGGPAESAGLKGSDRQVTISGQDLQVGGDVIVAINGQPVKEFEDLAAFLEGSTSVGQQVTLTVLRDGKEQSLKVTLAERPAAQPVQVSSGSQLPARAALGIRGITVSPEIAQAMNLPADQQGVLIEQVLTGSPADQAGLRAGSERTTVGGMPVLLGGDVIVSWNGQPVTTIEDLRALVQAAGPDEQVTLAVLRDGQPLDVVVTLASATSQP